MGDIEDAAPNTTQDDPEVNLHAGACEWEQRETVARDLTTFVESLPQRPG